jgi:hypothetical protein
MKKSDFFLAAMRAQEYRRRAWVVSAFSLIQEAPDAWQKNPYAYRVVQTPSGHFFVDPDNSNHLSPIEGTEAGQPPLSFKERLTLQAQTFEGLLPNDAQELETNYGNALFNYTAVAYPFGKKLPYQVGRVSPGQMEDLIIDRLKDTPKEGEPRNDQDIYVDEYLKFTNAMFYLAGFTQLCVPATTKKTMTPAPGIVELKERLLEENKERLHDPAVIAKIQEQLIAYDRAYMKGDPGENFLIGRKSFQVVRSKMFGMHGAETGLSESVDVELIRNSLSQGWDIEKFPAMNNSLRAGSFNRGAQTALGGESVKWLLRASSNIAVTQDDCGSRLGNTFHCDGSNFKWLLGFWVIKPSGDEQVTAENVSNYIGKTVSVRSPMYCKLDKTDYCAHCVGQRLAENPTGLSAAISEYGSAFLAIYMAAAHGKQLTLAKMDFKTAIQ